MTLSDAAGQMLYRNMRIGNICARWAHIEYLLAMTIGALLELDGPTGDIVTGGLDILQRTNMALTLCHHLNAPKTLIDGLRAVRNDLQDGKDLLERRNRAVHGYRELSDTPDAEIFTVFRGKGRGPKKISSADLDDLEHQVEATRRALQSTLKASGVFDRQQRKPTRIIAKKAARRTGPNESTSGS